jgi:HSP20 family molecular chaperone IbpA
MKNPLKKKNEVQNSSPEQIAEPGPAYRPDVDIFQTQEETFFLVDLPGVAKGEAKIEIDENKNLIVKAKTGVKEAAGCVLRQFNVGNYYRAFQISDEYDTDKVQANLQNGLLEIVLPKKEEARPRRIAIEA